ncbi:MAG: choice-of-anchor tandem repeat GloVer-containing protein [PVC group bacterium]
MKIIVAWTTGLAVAFTLAVNADAQVNFQVIHEFDGVNGANAPGHLISLNGRLYGMTAGDTAGNHGVIFSILPDGSDFTLIHRFAGQPDDGAWPHGSLNFFNDKLYGLTWAGGCDGTACPNMDGNGCGTVFSLQTGGGDYTVLWEFACSDFFEASLPNAYFISDGDELYSTTQTGGESGKGTVFSIKPDGTGFTVLYNFSGDGSEGTLPAAGLVLDGDTLYGTTSSGWEFPEDDKGTIFSLRKDGSDFTVIHKFNGTDGKMPFSAPIIIAGRIYGATAHRGESDNGVIFSLRTDGTDYTVLHYFASEDGCPMEGVVMAGDILYGATLDNSPPDYCGVIYSINADGSNYTELHRFNGSDGRVAYGRLLLVGNTFYGMAALGGTSGNGVIFSFQRPVPENPILQSGDYNGDGRADIAVFRPDSGLWAVRGLGRIYFGAAGDIPVSGDYNGDGYTDVGIFRRATGLWAVKNITRLYFGGSNDLPVPADYDGDGCCDAALFGEQSGQWKIRGITAVHFGSLGDRPAPGDYNGDGAADIALFRPDSGLWAVRGVTRCYFGTSGDVPVPGVFQWYGSLMSTIPFRDRIAVFRSATGLWAIRNLTRAYFGTSGDTPVAGDFTGNSLDDIAVFRPDSSLWAIRGLSRVYFGTPGDIPVTK